MTGDLDGRATADLWHVEIAPGDVQVVTLEELDVAFQEGWVNERTRVWQDGMAVAATLGELLGGDAESGDPGETSPPGFSGVSGSEPAPLTYQRPHQDTLIGLIAPGLPAISAARAPRESMWPPPPSAPLWPRSAAAPPAPSRQNTTRPVVGSWPPVVSASIPPPSAPSSVVPLALDLEPYGAEELEFRSSHPRGKGFAAGAALLAAAAAVAILAGGRGTAVPDSNTGTASVPRAIPVQVSRAYDPGNEPLKLREAEPPLVITKRGSPRVATAEPKRPARATKAAKAPPRATGRKRLPSFGSSGKNAKYDPLNGSL